jgi:DNA polymerase II small subunit
MFLSPDALEAILSNSNPVDFAVTVLSSLSSSPVFVTAKDILDFITGETAVAEPVKPIVPKNKRQHDIKVVPGTDITGESTCEGKIEDFARYFKSRYVTLRRMIESRRDFGRGMPIKDAASTERDVKIVGIVCEVTRTKNGHRMLTLEDDTGTCKVLFLRDGPLSNEMLVMDEVIGIAGRSTGKDMIMADSVFRPDVPAINNWSATGSTASVAFLSDIHVGSRTFLRSKWDGMIKWMKENAYNDDIDYLVIPGDAVDGIGIFPDQEKELETSDIYGQYGELAERIKELPDHIRIVLQPGNHDAVRSSEPQPALTKVFTEMFDSSVMMLGNPVYLEIEGRTVLSYHGRSIDDWVSGVQQLTYNDPVGIMKEMLTRRHLAPIYGQKTALAPEKKDYLLMEKVPDIFVTGHVHGAGHMNYRGVRTINASAWQDQTEYQRMHNFNPDPAVMPMVHLGTGKVTMKRF